MKNKTTGEEKEQEIFLADFHGLQPAMLSDRLYWHLAPDSVRHLLKVASGLVDAIVELTETGRSRRAHKLREVTTIIQSTTQFIANKNAYKDSWKKSKMLQICLLLKGAIQAEGKVGLKMNIRKANLKKIISLLPALKNPTISSLSQEGWLAVETIIEEKIVRNIIPQLKEAGAQGIIEYPLNKLIY